MPIFKQLSAFESMPNESNGKSFGHGEDPSRGAVDRKQQSSHVDTVPSIKITCEPSDLTPPRAIEKAVSVSHKGETSLIDTKQDEESSQYEQSLYNRKQFLSDADPPATWLSLPTPAGVASVAEATRPMPSSEIFIDHEEYFRRGGLSLLPELDDSPDSIRSDEDDDAELVALHNRAALPSVRLKPRNQKRSDDLLFLDETHFSLQPHESVKFTVGLSLALF
ncbi:hypothetical protein ACA910_013179 [Epithemia clementina (nom. ined.)]